eukprot:TRINITY_DN5535_c1_g2_i1.p9 TRINITY_DN5535_c1_g2~~TRINITY_DN5535_c1_g2_i1.p9  ORF type:complete len:108 (-),score=12.37 TRINITY_DN5535_c1_g2_i1:1675-1950(-)
MLVRLYGRFESYKQQKMKCIVDKNLIEMIKIRWEWGLVQGFVIGGWEGGLRIYRLLKKLQQKYYFQIRESAFCSKKYIGLVFCQIQIQFLY